ncbi:DUF4397 domain-containing protein [Thalassotalea agarivorans]|uniref:DUF4397 domain-containing protein n=1 Tax=Thalassotalea agarivorans TaxID=349064 RepID=A0A1H9Y5K1_THASX|nr:DUF4397 domain-containing protein [Thalassotalea agarivorans]SES63677.1 protein of unknown function [Thalassotalea agarivorans]
MNKITKSLLIALSISVLAACDDDDDDVVISPPPVEPGSSYIRVIHGSADAPAVNVNVDGAEALSMVDYTEGSGFIMLDEGSYMVTVDGILADESTVQVLDLGAVDLMADMEYTVFAHGYVADDGDTTNDLTTAVIANAKSDVTEGNIRLQVLHGAPNAPTVDLHVTGATDELGDPLGTLAYGDVTDQVEVAAGTYRVRLVIAEGDSMGAVAFDAVLPDLPAGSDLFVAAAPKTGVTTSPVQLIANNGTDTLTIIDDRTESWVRVVHAAPDVPEVDILVNDTAALTNVPFTGASDYLPLPDGIYNVKVALSSDNNVVGIEGDLDVSADMSYTVYAVGTLAAEDPDIPLEFYVLMDEVRSIATQASVRLTHAHPTVGNVDIYVTGDGVIDGVDPTFADIPFKASTGYVALPPGEYNVKITPPGDKTVVIDTGSLMLMGGGVYSATAVDNAGGTPANLILQDDFVN